MSSSVSSEQLLKRATKRGAARPARTTMDDIAIKAGVSRTTVSFVLNGRAEHALIPDATCQRVLEAAHDLGYQRNSLARAIATGQSRILGFVGHDEWESAEFQWRLLKGASEEAKKHGYLLKILLTSDPELAGRHCAEWRMDGLLTVTVENPVFGHLHAALEEHRVPVVLLEGEARFQDASCVHTDYRLGIAMVLRHLRELGHRDIAYISGSPQTVDGQKRAQDFREAIRELGLTAREDWMAQGDWWSVETNKKRARQLLDVGAANRPTAVVCAGDSVALSVLHVAHELGIRVPGELSVTGFANFQMARFSTPALTTVAQPFEEVGAAAVRRVLALIASGEPEADETLRAQSLAPQLIVRESTGRARTRP